MARGFEIQKREAFSERPRNYEIQKAQILCFHYSFFFRFITLFLFKYLSTLLPSFWTPLQCSTQATQVSVLFRRRKYLFLFWNFKCQNYRKNRRKKAFISYWRGEKIFYIISCYFLPNWSLEDMEACDISAISRKEWYQKTDYKCYRSGKVFLVYLLVTQW